MSPVAIMTHYQDEGDADGSRVRGDRFRCGRVKGSARAIHGIVKRGGKRVG